MPAIEILCETTQLKHNANEEIHICHWKLAFMALSPSQVNRVKGLYPHGVFPKGPVWWVLLGDRGETFSSSKSWGANFTIDQWSDGIRSWGWFLEDQKLKMLKRNSTKWLTKWLSQQVRDMGEWLAGLIPLPWWTQIVTIKNTDSDSSLCVEWNVHLDLWIYTLSYVYVTYVYFLILYTYILCYACNIYIYIRTYLYIFGRDRNRNPNPKHKKDRIQALDVCIFS